MKITIKNEQIELKNKLRAILIYEQITGRTFNPQTMTDMIIYFYCVVLSCKPELTLDFSEFMELLDNEPELLKSFNQWIVEVNKVNSQYSDGDDLKKSPYK